MHRELLGHVAEKEIHFSLHPQTADASDKRNRFDACIPHHPTVFFSWEEGGNTMQWWCQCSGWHSFWDSGHWAIKRNGCRWNHKLVSIVPWVRHYLPQKKTIYFILLDQIIDLKADSCRHICIMCIMGIMAIINFQQKGRFFRWIFLCIAITAS